MRVLARARPEDQAGGLGVTVTLRAAIDAAEPQIARIPANAKARLPEALQRLIDLYTAWDKPDEAAKGKRNSRSLGLRPGECGSK